ncbi:MAG TPA: hypothetical protein VGH76_25205 [Actinomycetospora sp.]|uniref:hypothetical protein n=1 Tax=Actinomycetospora sp. TaxID=1872135 RepID=UPI002F3F3601
MTGEECTNCGGPDGERLSFDLDLPPIVMCQYCSILMVTNRELFDKVGGRGRSKRKTPLSSREEKS